MGYYFNIERDIKDKINQVNTSISSAFLTNLVNIEFIIDKYFNQANYIEELKRAYDSNENYKIKYNLLKNKNNELQKLLHLNYKYDYNLIRLKVLSYVNLNDMSKVTLDYNLDDNSKIYALLTYDGFSAGIAFKKDGQNIAYLNSNERCNYTVFIGNNNAPGITSGMDSQGSLVIKYIPLWKKINVDDEIITSGMDEIYPYGIKVGVVKYIKKGETTQEVLAKPYSSALSERYFYLYDVPK